MRVVYLLLALLVVMILLLVYIAGLPEPAASSGIMHPLIENMRVGGDGLLRFIEVGPPAFWLQVVVLVFSMVLVLLGISERRRGRALYVCLGFCGALSLFSWYMVYNTYQFFLLTGEVNYFFGFPVPSGWMIYGTWLSGLALVALYVLGFNRFIFTEEDEAEYLALVDEVQSAGESGPDSGLI